MSYYEIWNDTQSPTGGYTIKKFTPNGYPRHSVLRGQTRIEYHDHFDTLEEAQAAFPDANCGGPFISEQNTFDHLDDREGDIY